MRKNNTILAKNKELTASLIQVTQLANDQKAEIEELQELLHTMSEEKRVMSDDFNDERLELNDVISHAQAEVEQERYLRNGVEKELDSAKAQLQEMTEKLNRALDELNHLRSARQTAPVQRNTAKQQDTPVQLSMTEEPQQGNKNYRPVGGVQMVSRAARLDESKLPPMPKEPEFKTEYTLYTDGACLGNGQPGLGYGGWAAVIVNNKTMEIEEMVGSEGPGSTNQRMEVTAIMRGIEALMCETQEDVSVTICSDSQYAIKGITQWGHNWIANNWTNSAGNPVANKELWQEIFDMIHRCDMNLEFKWVKGHAGHYFNSRCDLLATSEAAEKADACGCEAFKSQIPTY